MGRTSSNSTGNLGVVQVWKLQCRNLGDGVGSGQATIVLVTRGLGEEKAGLVTILQVTWGMGVGQVLQL